MLRMTDLTRMFGVDQSTIYRWEKREGFPPRVHMGSNSVAWPLDEVEAWSAMRPRGPKSGKSATA
jgi:predicted DNA-binding transcriptional regulator AlpA